MALDNQPAALTHYSVIHAKLITACADQGRVRYFPVAPKLDYISKFLLIQIVVQLFEGNHGQPIWWSLPCSSTARFAFVGREFFTCSSLSFRQSSFCFCVAQLQCSNFWGIWRLVLFLNNFSHEWISNFDWSLLLRWWGHYRICKSKASHAHRETKEVALYFTDCMVGNSLYENLIDRALEWL